jgi:hypothetical protein
MKTVWVIVPVYYNAESLSLLFAELQKVEEQLHDRDCKLQKSLCVPNCALS